MKIKRFILIDLIILLCLVLGYVAYQQKHKVVRKNVVATAILVDVATVKTQNMDEKIRTIGNLLAFDTVQVSPEIAGQVAKIAFHAGQQVSQGRVLIQLDDSLQRADLHSAQADLSLSEVNYKRNQALLLKGAIAQETVDQAKADYLAKKAAVHRYQLKVEKMELVAPFDGVVGAKQVSVGQYVAVGQNLVEIVSQQQLQIQYNVSQAYVAKLHKGQMVTISTTALPGEKFTGKVFYVSPTIDADSRTVEVRALVPNAQHKLSAGLFVQVGQSLGQRPNVMVIPRQAIIASLEGESVVQVVKGKAEFVTVETGVTEGDNIEILSGLTPGDSIVIAGQQNLRAGMPVMIKSRATL